MACPCTSVLQVLAEVIEVDRSGGNGRAAAPATGARCTDVPPIWAAADGLPGALSYASWAGLDASPTPDGSRAHAGLDTSRAALQQHCSLLQLFSDSSLLLRPLRALPERHLQCGATFCSLQPARCCWPMVSGGDAVAGGSDRPLAAAGAGFHAPRQCLAPAPACGTVAHHLLKPGRGCISAWGPRGVDSGRRCRHRWCPPPSPLALPPTCNGAPHPLPIRSSPAGAHAKCKADKPDEDPVTGCTKCDKDGSKCLECGDHFGLASDGTCVRCTVPGYYGDKCIKCDGDKPDVCLT